MSINSVMVAEQYTEIALGQKMYVARFNIYWLYGWTVDVYPYVNVI